MTQGKVTAALLIGTFILLTKPAGRLAQQQQQGARKGKFPTGIAKYSGGSKFSFFLRVLSLHCHQGADPQQTVRVPLHCARGDLRVLHLRPQLPDQQHGLVLDQDRLQGQSHQGKCGVLRITGLPNSA